MTRPAEPGQVKDRIAAAAATLTIWYLRLNEPDGAFAEASDVVLGVIDGVIRDLQQARGLLTGQLQAEENAQIRRVDAMLAQRRGAACLHGEDSRHSRAHGEPVYVGCGCGCLACSTSEAKADPQRAEAGA